jgi:hypothetical protein
MCVIKRNYIDPKYCPVSILLRWLKVTGITSGPIMPGGNAGTSELHQGTYNPTDLWKVCIFQ